MSPIDSIVSCEDCGRRLNEEGQEEEYFYVTTKVESTKTLRTSQTLIVLCEPCLKRLKQSEWSMVVSNEP